MQISARIDIFRKDNVTLEIKAKADMLALLAYLGKGDLCDKPWVPWCIIIDVYLHCQVVKPKYNIYRMCFPKEVKSSKGNKWTKE